MIFIFKRKLNCQLSIIINNTLHYRILIFIQQLYNCRYNKNFRIISYLYIFYIYLLFLYIHTYSKYVELKNVHA